MSFYGAVNDAIGRANSAAQQLYGYNNYADPRSQPNGQIRNNARLTIDPAYQSLQYESRNAYWQGVPRRDVNQALQASELIRQATYDLSDRPVDNPNQPANVPLAQQHIQYAIQLLNQARY